MEARLIEDGDWGIYWRMSGLEGGISWNVLQASHLDQSLLL